MIRTKVNARDFLRVYYMKEILQDSSNAANIL